MLIALDTKIKFSVTGTYAPEILIFLAQVSRYSLFSYHQLTPADTEAKGFLLPALNPSTNYHQFLLCMDYSHFRLLRISDYQI